MKLMATETWPKSGLESNRSPQPSSLQKREEMIDTRNGNRFGLLSRAIAAYKPDVKM
jgi:hypothetical protein